MKDKLTVIVPVYNVENYIDTCLESIENQDYEPMEVILVDDGSPDGSARICEEMALKDDRFCVIHKKNEGASSARNVGILLSKTDKIAFVDSDDALIGQPYSYLLNIMEQLDADVISMKSYASREPLHYVAIKSDYVQKEEISSEEMYSRLCLQTFSDAPWDKIYSATLFDRLLFCEGMQNEDFLILIKIALLKNLRIIQTDFLGYYYFLRTGSITGSGFKQNMIDAVHNAQFALLNTPDKKYERAAEYYMLHKALMFFINMPKSYISAKNEHYLFTLDCVRRLRKKIPSSACSTRDKVCLIMFLHMPKITKKIVDTYMARFNNK